MGVCMPWPWPCPVGDEAYDEHAVEGARDEDREYGDDVRYSGRLRRWEDRVDEPEGDAELSYREEAEDDAEL
jgi:hypothetical protein